MFLIPRSFLMWSAPRRPRRRGWLGMYARPGTSSTIRPDRMQVDVGGVPLAYEKRGAGPPLVLIAGTGLPGATWDEDLVAPLAERHTVVTFDHRGAGAAPPASARLAHRLPAAAARGR